MEDTQCEQDSLRQPDVMTILAQPPPHGDGDLPCSTPAKKRQFIFDGNCSNWHQSPIFVAYDGGRKSTDGLTILDFDLDCATVAPQRDSVPADVHGQLTEVGVQRMWEGGVFDCLDDREIALQTLCCPCITHGKNLNRAGFGSCISKSGIHFLLIVGVVINYILFLCAYGHLFLYFALVLLISVAVYGTYYRIQIRKRFNIKGGDVNQVINAMDDGVNHILCCLCTLCQEARTLEINNVHDGNWHGRGDRIWVGRCGMYGNEDNQHPNLELPLPVDVQECSSHSWNPSQEEGKSLVNNSGS